MLYVVVVVEVKECVNVGECTCVHVLCTDESPCAYVGALSAHFALDSTILGAFCATMFTCTQVTTGGYDVLELLRGTNVSNLVNDIETLLPLEDISLEQFIPINTGVSVNISRLFSGNATVLNRIRTQLNLSSGVDVVDVGQLFKNGTDGLPVVNNTELIDLLPQVRDAHPSHYIMFPSYKIVFTRSSR
jgi:hypothetical protein